MPIGGNHLMLASVSFLCHWPYIVEAWRGAPAHIVNRISPRPDIQRPEESGTGDGHMVSGMAANRRSIQEGLKATPASVDEVLLAIGGGTGGMSPVTNKDMILRMHMQDKAVILVLLIAYIGLLLFSASLAYRQASNNSPITYYADPRYHDFATEGRDVDSFLSAFGQPPKKIFLHVTGYVPNNGAHWREDDFELHGQRYSLAFSFALDLSAWIVTQTGASNDSDAAASVPVEDIRNLGEYLRGNDNDLAVVEFRKEVSWPDWEELAMNIKLRIRQRGFTSGVIRVHQTPSESVSIHKNRPWANFMHSRSVQVISALSLFGWMVHQPYMWLRTQRLVVRSQYHVDIPISSYWSLIDNKIGPDGFDDGSAARPL